MTHTPNDREAAEVLAALREADSRICRHESTHRGGAIWEICDDCDQQWADDRGGRKTDPWPQMLESAYRAIALLQSPTAPSFTTGHCENHKQPGGCQLHNLQCGYPKCDQRPVESSAPVQQGEASVSTLPDLYWHITRNALRDGSPFAVACMGALPALNAAIAALAPSRQAGGEAELHWVVGEQVFGRPTAPDALEYANANWRDGCEKDSRISRMDKIASLYTHPTPSAESAFVRVPAAKLVRAAELAESDGDEHGIGRVLRDLVASAPERAP